MFVKKTIFNAYQEFCIRWPIQSLLNNGCIYWKKNTTKSVFHGKKSFIFSLSLNWLAIQERIKTKTHNKDLLVQAMTLDRICFSPIQAVSTAQPILGISYPNYPFTRLIVKGKNGLVALKCVQSFQQWNSVQCLKVIHK